MSEWITVVILGIIEGITEFLPISSTGHLLLADHILPFKQSEVFLAVIQCGAVLAVLAVFKKRIQELLSRWREKETLDYILKLAAAFVITGIGGVLLKHFGFKLPKDPAPVAWATLIGGILILIVEGMIRGKNLSNGVSWTAAILIGAAQLLAPVFPGASRSGVTILMGLCLGINRPAATEFSFLLGVPTLFAAGALEIHHGLKHPDEAGPIHWNMVLLGTVVSAIVAFASVRWLLQFIRSHTFVGFGWYRIILGVGILLLLR